MYEAIRPLLFRLDPEVAHTLSLRAMHMVGGGQMRRELVRRMLSVPSKPQPIEVFGVTFPNCLGLAAGYDKDGLGWRGLSALGFGHVEVGTVTPQPQGGNPKPRVFRLPEDQSLINRMGFPSEGLDTVLSRLSSDRPYGMVLGVNLGKNKDTPLEEAAQDYAGLLRRFASVADYLVVNVSSPNTPGLRRLQKREALSDLLGQLAEVRAEEVKRCGRPVPLLVKIAPDLDSDGLDDALDAILAHKLDGVIATNTTISREGLRSSNSGETGGLSGAALTDRSTAMIRDIWARTGGSLAIVGVGGIMGPDDAQAKLDAGAVLVQVFTGLIYKGPGIARDILKAL